MFYPVRTFADVVKDRRESINQFYKTMYKTSPGVENKALATWESRWCELKRPHFNVYPGILKPLLRLKLDKVPVSSLSYPTEPIVARLPVGHGMIIQEGREVQWIMICPSENVLLVWFFNDEYWEGQPIRSYVEADIQDDRITVRDCINNDEHVTAWSPVLTLAVALGLFAKDSELVSPDILSADVGKQVTPELINKAHRRGKISWSIGRGVEVSPHFRSGCPLALYWTGPGRKIPFIRSRRGAIVHRRKAQEVHHEG